MTQDEIIRDIIIAFVGFLAFVLPGGSIGLIIAVAWLCAFSGRMIYKIRNDRQ